MKISFDEKEITGALLCGKIEVNNKPTLLTKTLANKKVMLVIVDMVKGFCVSGALSSLRCGVIGSEIKRIANMLPGADRVFIRDCHTPKSVEFNYFPEHCVGEESEIIPELITMGGLEVKKNSTNGFIELLGARSNLLDYDAVIVTGVCTDICVLQLALSVRAYISEFNGNGNVIVFTDAVETYDTPTHNADLYNLMAVKLMEQSGVRVFKKLV